MSTLDDVGRILDLFRADCVVFHLQWRALRREKRLVSKKIPYNRLDAQMST